MRERDSNLGFVEVNRSTVWGKPVMDGLFIVRPPICQPAPLRQIIENEIERLIAFLDTVDGDCDLEDGHDQEQCHY